MRFLLFLLLLAVAAALAWWQWEEHIPHHWHPWAPLSVDDPLTPVTKWKLHRLADDREGCLAALETAPEDALSMMPLDDHEPVQGCPLENVVRIHASEVEFNASFVARCPLALAWVMYERQRLQPAAEAHFGSRVARVEHYGSFACRNVYGRAEGRLSEHATAEALDVAAFHLEDGRRITLLDHWEGEDPRADFLRDARDGACDLFGNVLGPDYNLAHADHFHFGMRGFRLCR
ncbi:extensin family protein [Billgrantia kenyensis]|uniref:Extensin family protein n=1 Tax=Billgrantia kenyensis TaxID=321266 RepID=A0A7V9W4K4_9GAMM|nr:extensin family protein [Halomonas kenyensis]MBA2780963.1 extensin family protein [Halomonas kenyensis]MCG6663298.1 extensin family protein [Halomonas kenyensis]